jgi:transcriptional regulator GlxA family with amidase domain
MTCIVDILPTSKEPGGTMLRNVAAVVFDGVAPFELGALCEAWGIDRRAQGVPHTEFAVCAERPGRVATSMGFGLEVRHGLDRLEEADLIAVPAMPRDKPVPPAVIEALQAAYERDVRILSVCVGAFTLGAAGLLDGRECTTHWLYSDELAERFPLARVNPEVLYVDADPIITSAGSAAGLDACLHLMRKEWGAHAANMAARRMVVPPQRDGGQAQFVRTPVPASTGETMTPLLTWVLEHLDRRHSVQDLAERAHMSPRTFARRFRDETGTTPHQWIVQQRVQRAEELLERTELSVEQIAAEVGFGNAAALRHHFTQVRGTSPKSYRQTFGRAG